MKLKNSSNEAYCIILKEQESESWQYGFEKLTTPTTITFSISTTKPQLEIKKIVWDFGNGNQHKSFTNRKQNLQGHTVDCKYRKSHNTTISVMASVYTDEQMYITKPVSGISVNTELKEYYVEPDVFKKQIMQFYKTKVFTHEVADSINKIANRLAFAPNFINYTYREEMVGDALIRMIEALKTQKFNPNKGNPFSYFTKIAFHAFCNRIKKEKKMREALVNYQNDVYNEMVDDGELPYARPNQSEGDDGYYHEDS